MSKEKPHLPPHGDSSANLPLIIALVAVSALVLLGLVFFSNRPTGPLTVGQMTSTAQVARDTAVADAFTAMTSYCNDNPERCLTSGNPDAPVKVFEFSDYGCPACQYYNQTVEPTLKTEYIDSGKISYVRVPVAILGNAAGGLQTPLSPQAVLCANEQGKGNEYHVKIFDVQSPHADIAWSAMETLAGELGLDVNKFKACFDNGSYEGAANANRGLVEKVKVNSTPTLFVNGKAVVGADYGQLSAAIQAELNNQ